MKFPLTGKSTDKAFLDHLEDLRKVFFRILICLLILLPLTTYFASYMIEFLVRYSCPPGLKLSYFSPLEPVWVEIKTALAASAFLGFPYIMYEVWKFVAPGLYKHEKNFAFKLVLSSWLLFITGTVFAFYSVLPLVMKFSMSLEKDYLCPTIGLQNFISLTALMMLGFGVMFQFPVAIFLLVRTGLVRLETLRKQRAMMIIIILVLAALLAPTPDVVTQLIMAVPTYFLFELSLLITGWTVKEPALPEETDDDDEPPAEPDEDSGVNPLVRYPRNKLKRRRIRSVSKR